MMTSQSVSMRGLRESMSSGPIRSPQPTSKAFIPSVSTSGRLDAARPLSDPVRTAPLPALKSLFTYNAPPEAPAQPAEESFTPELPFSAPSPGPEEALAEVPPAAEAVAPPAPEKPSQEAEELAAARKKIAQLDEELAGAIRVKELSVNEAVLLHRQLEEAQEALKEHEGGQTEEISRLIGERNAAVDEAASLREELHQARRAHDELQGSAGKAVESELATKARESQQGEEISRLTAERDAAVGEAASLREELSQVRQTHDELQFSAGKAVESELATKARESRQAEEISSLTADRNAALDEAVALREELRQARQANEELQAAAGNANEELQAAARKAGEFELALKERDQSRKDYTILRGQFENLKRDYARKKGESTGSQSEFEEKEAEFRRQIEARDQQIEEREREISALKGSSAGAGGDAEALQQELNGLRDQLTQARDEASVAQRGLALSQKALQETRQALCEAMEGATQTKLHLEGLKNDYSTLMQRNTQLQGRQGQAAKT